MLLFVPLLRLGEQAYPFVRGNQNLDLASISVNIWTQISFKV